MRRATRQERRPVGLALSAKGPIRSCVAWLRGAVGLGHVACSREGGCGWSAALTGRVDRHVSACCSRRRNVAGYDRIRLVERGSRCHPRPQSHHRPGQGFDDDPQRPRGTRRHRRVAAGAVVLPEHGLVERRTAEVGCPVPVGTDQIDRRFKPRVQLEMQTHPPRGIRDSTVIRSQPSTTSPPRSPVCRRSGRRCGSAHGWKGSNMRSPDPCDPPQRPARFRSRPHTSPSPLRRSLSAYRPRRPSSGPGGSTARGMPEHRARSTSSPLDADTPFRHGTRSTRTQGPPWST